MFITKFWTLLVTLVGVVMLSVIILSKDVINRERIENTTAILYKEITKADVALKLHARARLDKLLKVAVDPEVRGALAVASNKPANADAIRDNLLNALRTANRELKEYEGHWLAALDIHGTVVTQVGDREAKSGENFAGFPAVDAALRGFIRDDIWKIDKDLLLIACRPVIHEGRYVGAILHAMRITDKLATEISPTVQMALFAGDLIMAVGTPKIEGQPNADGSYIGDPLKEILSSKDFNQRGYSDVRTLKTKTRSFMAVYSRIRGEAAKNGVGYAVVYPLDAMASPKEVYERATKQDIQELPWVWLITGFVLLTLMAWFWSYFEGQRPVSRLLKSIEALAKSDPKDQLNVYRFRRKMRKIAIAINTVIDYKMKSLVDDTKQGERSIDSILGEASDERLSSASFKFIEPESDDVPPPPPPPEEAPEEEAEPKPPPAPKKKKSKAKKDDSRSGGPPPAPKRPKSKPTVVDEEAYFHEVYEEFLALKKELGESVDQLTYDKFKGTLVKNRDTLKDRYGCASVKFHVYEKGGKASLKATPVKK
jgi:hypothetical protein